MIDDTITPEMRARADAVVEAMRARWVARDAVTDQANRAFDAAFRRALRAPQGRGTQRADPPIV